MSRSESPFDPFSIDDDFEPSSSSAAAGPPPPLLGASDADARSLGDTKSQSTNTSRTTTTTNRNRAATPLSRLEGVAEEGGHLAKPLPPRLNVKLAIHEEVSSTSVADPDGGGGSLSQLSIEGKVTACVESSNANENAPFRLQISGPMASLASITCHEHCALVAAEDPASKRCKVDIPKAEGKWCDVLNYSMTVRTQNMPILVQAKAAIKDEQCRISVQVRSNLSNQGDLSDFTIVVAIPTTLKGDVKVTRGEKGVWDANKRIVTWKIGDLPHGESALVTAEAGISPAMSTLLQASPFNSQTVEDKVQCPVLVRCRSEVDQVSDVALNAMTMMGSPATIVQHQTKSYRLLHRVGKTGV